MQKCKLASPSVTKCTRSWLSTSDTRPAIMAARRICPCWETSQPLGCAKMKSMLCSTEFQWWPPSVSRWMYDFVHSNRYRRKSEKTATGVLFPGRAGMSKSSCNESGRRCSLNLRAVLEHEYLGGRVSQISPWDFNKTFLFCLLDESRFHGLGTDSPNGSFLIIIEDRWYLRWPTDFCLRRKTK